MLFISRLLSHSLPTGCREEPLFSATFILFSCFCFSFCSFISDISCFSILASSFKYFFSSSRLQKQYGYALRAEVPGAALLPGQSHRIKLIIEPETFDRVQDMIAQRSRERHFSGATIFSTKIRCGECGGWFGSKVWHSTDPYRKVIWRCNTKYGRKSTGCKTPHVTEEEVKAAFVRVVNKLIGDRAALLADLQEIQETYSGTDELSQRLHELDDRLNAEAEAVQELIAQNARVAQNQDDYNAAYEAAVSRYEATKAEREKVAADIRQRGIRRREFERFITELEKLPEVVSVFDDTI